MCLSLNFKYIDKRNGQKRKKLANWVATCICFIGDRELGSPKMSLGAVWRKLRKIWRTQQFQGKLREGGLDRSPRRREEGEGMWDSPTNYLESSPSLPGGRTWPSLHSLGTACSTQLLIAVSLLKEFHPGAHKGILSLQPKDVGCSL